MKAWKGVRFVLVVALLGGGLWGVAYAQEPAAAPGNGTPTAQPGGSKVEQNLSPQDQVARGEAMVANMDRTRKDVQSKLSRARREGDVVKALCLDDKLTQMDTAIRSAGERLKSLRQAAKTGDASLASHEFMVLNVLNDRMRQLKAEANQCIGNDMGMPGETSVKVSIDPNLPHEDPADYPEGNGAELAPPVCVSCVR